MTTYTTYAQKGIREDLSDMIYDISPTDTPVMTALRKGSPAKNTRIEWQTDALAAAGTNENVEGADVVYNTASPTARLANFTQIFDKAVVVSDTADAVTTAGRRKELAYQIAKRSKEIKRDIEFTITGNQASRAGGTATARRLGAIETWLRTNVSRGTGGASGGYTSTGVTVAATDASTTNRRTFTEARLKSVIRNAWEAGGEPSLVVVGSFNKQQASLFDGIATLYRDTAGQNSPKSVRIMGAADIYVSDFGEHRIVPNRFSRARSALVIDPEYWSMHYLQSFQVTPLARTGHAEKRMIHAELTLCAKNEAANGIVADLTQA